MIRDSFDGLGDATADVCVIGAGPVGISLAVELDRLGMSVLLLESGGRTADPQVQSLAEADLFDPKAHDSMQIATARRLGGTSNLWGGRCLPYDPIDFMPRPGVVDARWPIGLSDIAPYYDAACRYTDSGAADFARPPSDLTPNDPAFSLDSLERWSNTPRLQVLHNEALKTRPGIDVRLNAVVTGVDFHEDGRASAASVTRPDGSLKVRVPVRTVVLAAGGVETTRLLLAAGRNAPSRFSGDGGPLGRYYMGHVVGTIADVTLSDAKTDAAFDFTIDEHGSYVRRRFTPSAELQQAEGIMNCSLWPVVPSIWDAQHGSGILSLIYLGLSYEAIGKRMIAEALRKRHLPPEPVSRLPHMVNVLKDLPVAAPYILSFLWKRRFAKARVPGFYLHSANYRYGLQFHSEQWPNPDSRIILTGEEDRLGLAKVHIGYRYHENDARSILHTHELLATWLKETGVGRLDYRQSPEARVGAILDHAKHGAHQIGTTRMGANRREGVVDGDLRTFDAANLFVASSSALPTSGQANPTLTVVALALRLAQRLAREARAIQPAAA